MEAKKLRLMERQLEEMVAIRKAFASPQPAASLSPAGAAPGVGAPQPAPMPVLVPCPQYPFITGFKSGFKAYRKVVYPKMLGAVVKNLGENGGLLPKADALQVAAAAMGVDARDAAAMRLFNAQYSEAANQLKGEAKKDFLSKLFMDVLDKHNVSPVRLTPRAIPPCARA